MTNLGTAISPAHFQTPMASVFVFFLSGQEISPSSVYNTLLLDLGHDFVRIMAGGECQAMVYHLTHRTLPRAKSPSSALPAMI